MSEVFTGVFVHRYRYSVNIDHCYCNWCYCRDSYYEIRALCISELGVWMNNYRYSILYVTRSLLINIVIISLLIIIPSTLAGCSMIRYTHTHVHIHSYTHIRTHVHTCMHTYTVTHTYVHTYIHACTHNTHMRTHTYLHTTHSHTYTHTHTHTHTHTQQSHTYTYTTYSILI